MSLKKVTAPVPQPAQPARAAVPVGNKVNFMSDEFYNSSLGIPDGQWILFHQFVVNAYSNKQGVSKGPATLGVMVTGYALSNPTADPKTKFLSMGKDAHLSFIPCPDDNGKTLMAVPGANATGISDMCNWSVYRDSLKVCGMPPLPSDLSLIDGTWAHINNIAESKDRAEFAAAKNATAEKEITDESRKPQKTMVVTSILPFGEPWNGGGGIPAAGKAKPNGHGAVASAPAPVPAAPVPAAAPTPVPAAPAEDEGITDEDVKRAASEGASKVIESNPKGCKRLKFKLDVQKYVGSTYGDEVSALVGDTFFSTDAAFEGIIGEFGYKISGIDIVQA